MGYIEKQRTNQVKKLVPQLFSDPGVILYIGASQKRWHLADELKEAGNELILIEAFVENAEFHRGHYVFDVVYHIDIVMMTKYYASKLKEENIKHVVWWHGPEHIEKKELKPTLRKLYKGLGNGVLLVGCPYGRYEQGFAYGNPYEEHLNHIYPNDLRKLGFQTATIGKADQKGSNLIGWKIKKN